MNVAADRALSEDRSRMGSHVHSWKVINALRDGKTDLSTPIATDKLVSHFQSVFGPPAIPPVPAPLPDAPVPPHLTSLVQCITQAEFDNAVRDTNLSSAPGPDGLPPRLIVDALKFPPFRLFLFHFIVMCHRLEYVPVQWREAHVFILYKGKGNPLDPNSYRGISLTSIFAKIYERILLSRLQRWSYTTPIASLPQFGFRSGCSTVQAVFTLQTLVHEVVTVNKRPLFAAFVDLTKAFPSLNRDKMFTFLLAKGVPAPLVRAIRSFYIGNKAHLRIDNLLSTAINVTLGVLEGSVLSPFLFSVVFSVVWDFVSVTNFPSAQPRILRMGDIWLIAYADDLIILSLDHAILSAALANLFVTLADFNLIMSLIKTETMTFSPPRVRSLIPNQTFALHGSTLTNVDVFKYLGVFVCSRWNWSNHVTEMTGRAEAAAAELHRILERLEVRDVRRTTAFYRSLVESQWYGLELMPLRAVSEIESVRARFVKRLFDLPRSTANAISQVIFDLWPVAFEMLLRRLTFLRSMTNHDLTAIRDSFIFDRQILFREHQGWHFECFLIYRSLFLNAAVHDFDFESVMHRLETLTRSKDDFLFALLKESEETTLGPFRCFASARVLSSFREMLGRVSRRTASMILIFCSSGLRFRFFSHTAILCPACRRPWLTEHLFTCSAVEQLLAWNAISYEAFCSSMREGDWVHVLGTMVEVLRVWKSWAVACEIDDDLLTTMTNDISLAS